MQQSCCLLKEGKEVGREERESNGKWGGEGHGRKKWETVVLQASQCCPVNWTGYRMFWASKIQDVHIEYPHPCLLTQQPRSESPTTDLYATQTEQLHRFSFLFLRWNGAAFGYFYSAGKMARERKQCPTGAPLTHAPQWLDPSILYDWSWVSQAGLAFLSQPL